MELGGQSLHDHLNANAGKLTNAQIEQLVKDIALAMRDFHRVAMHLDLKPGNMMYFRDPNGANAKILKAIDFGHSTLLNRDHQAENLVNYWRNANKPIGTQYYTSPEADEPNANIMLTPKADIWSIGIMIYEAILWNLQTDLEFFYDLMGEKLPPTQIIGELNNLYKFTKDQWMTKRMNTIRWTKKKQRNKTDEQLAPRIHIEYAAYIYLVFKIRSNSIHWILYELINACLVLEPKERLSAVGILEYLEGNCQLRLVNEQNRMQILYDQQIAQIIADHLKATKSKLSYQYKRLLPKLHYNEKEKEKRNLQLKEIERIKGFATWNGPTVNLRTPIHNTVDPSPHRNQQLKWCDTQTSDLPTFKMEAEVPIDRPSPSAPVYKEEGISEIHEEEQGA